MSSAKKIALITPGLTGKAVAAELAFNQALRLGAERLKALEPQLMTKAYLGPAGDGKTNRWRITCGNCSKIFIPPPTIMREDLLTCPKCRLQFLIDYDRD